MLELNIIGEKAFGFKYLNVTPKKIINKFLVPDDYILSPLLNANMLNNEIYLEKSEYYPPESLIIGQSINLEDALIYADYYQMYNVPSYMSFLCTLKITSFPLFIPEPLLDNSLHNKLAEDLIIYILKYENDERWKNQIFNRGKLDIDNIIDIRHYMKNLYVEKIPTSIQSYLHDPVLCWKNIKNRNDIKKLLYLAMELKIKINMDILNIATSYSSIECYPYDDYILSGTPQFKINRITSEFIMDSLNIIEQLIIRFGGDIYYSSTLKAKLRGDHVVYDPEYENGIYRYANYVNNIDDFINVIQRGTIITKNPLDDTLVVYYAKNKNGTFNVLKVLDEPDNLFNLKIFMNNDKLNISATPEYLVYMCTGIIPVINSSIVHGNKVLDNYSINSSRNDDEIWVKIDSMMDKGIDMSSKLSPLDLNNLDEIFRRYDVYYFYDVIHLPINNMSVSLFKKYHITSDKNNIIYNIDDLNMRNFPTIKEKLQQSNLVLVYTNNIDDMIDEDIEAIGYKIDEDIENDIYLKYSSIYTDEYLDIVVLSDSDEGDIFTYITDDFDYREINVSEILPFNI